MGKENCPLVCFDYPDGFLNFENSEKAVNARKAKILAYCSFNDAFYYLSWQEYQKDLNSSRRLIEAQEVEMVGGLLEICIVRAAVDTLRKGKEVIINPNLCLSSHNVRLEDGSAIVTLFKGIKEELSSDGLRNIKLQQEGIVFRFIPTSSFLREIQSKK